MFELIPAILLLVSILLYSLGGALYILEFNKKEEKDFLFAVNVLRFVPIMFYLTFTIFFLQKLLADFNYSFISFFILLIIPLGNVIWFLFFEIPLLAFWYSRKKEMYPYFHLMKYMM